MKNRITGRSAFLALLEDEGITHLFGNPGTTELPIMHALKDHPDLTYVMAMQESLVVAIADGYSRASGRLVACNDCTTRPIAGANTKATSADPPSTRKMTAAVRSSGSPISSDL